jgi:hypothetical protein
MRRQRVNEFDVPLRCELCGRTAEGYDWPTDECHGFRYCGACAGREKYSRLVLIPRPLSAGETAEWDGQKGG